MSFRSQGFVDGAYLRKVSAGMQLKLLNPKRVIERVVFSDQIQSWCAFNHTIGNIRLARTIYYDAKPNTDSIDETLKEYWDKVELLDDTELGFGSLRGGTRRNPPRQKGVDTLITVDLLVGAFTKIFDVAILIAGDADFVPAINEIKRRGIMVVIAAEERSVSSDLKRAADRFYPLELEQLKYHQLD